MDTTKTTHISLCTGYAGIDLGLRRCISNLRTVAYSEIEAFACENLLARMEGGQLDAAPIWTDLKSFPWEAFRDRVDILTGGYPCQPFSSAGKRLGTEDPRHLWPYIANGIRLLRPRLCFFENVEGHISLGLREVIEELEGLGYRVSWGVFSAAEVGAPHQRKRVFILAYRNDAGLEGHWRHVAEYDAQGRQEQAGHAWPSRPGEPQHAWEPPRVVGNSSGQRRPEVAGSSFGDEEANGGTRRDIQQQDGNHQSNRADESHRNRQTEPPLGGDAHGATSGLDYAKLCVSCDNRTDELRLLGNGVVPATAAKAFVILLNELSDTFLQTKNIESLTH